MSDLGLNIHHTEVIANYMAFTKLQRVQNLRTIDGLFQDVFDSRLLDSSYTVDEVQDILYSLRKLLKGELESGLMDVNHMNVLMLQQLFSQAENWHLKLEINLSELQNRSLLEVVKEIDQNGFAPQENRIIKSDDPNDPVGLLQLEIKKLNRDISNNEDEIEKLKSKLAEQEKEFINFGNARHLDTRKEEKNPEEQKNLVLELQEKIKELEEKIKNADKNQEILVSSEYQDHKSTKEKLQQTQSQLKLAELELERKFKETTAFINLKKLLDSKNEQIKILRKKLENLEEHSGKTDVIEESENDEIRIRRESLPKLAESVCWIVKEEMSLVEGVGDEVTHFFIALIVVGLALIAWWSTNISDTPLVRTVLVLERRRVETASPRNDTQSRTPPNLTSATEAPSSPEEIPEPEAADGVSSSPISNNEEPKEDNEVTPTTTSTESTPQPELRSEVRRRCLDAVENKNSQSNNHISDDSGDVCIEDEITTGSIRIRLKYLNDEQKLVQGRLAEPLGDFKRRHFNLELSANKLVRLIFNGQVLARDGASLEENGLFDNCVIHCLVHQPRNTSSNNNTSSTESNNSVPREEQQQQNSNEGNRLDRLDLGTLLFVLLSILLGMAWYGRCIYSQYFTNTASVTLIGLTDGTQHAVRESRNFTQDGLAGPKDLPESPRDVNTDFGRRKGPLSKL
ncbi:Hypothetical predicted protein [Cloeon dipterum]|uniref:Ubiquitin-like domain-containing protein n=1 Tax=Cloeon dipterum TaxID=197152 RepID=A0A8S1CCE3_9INSE|nr:Hypothetical predicted protein [Cloeon dipterum]